MLPMKFACMTTFAEQKHLMLHSISSLHSVWINYIKKHFQNVAYRICLHRSCLDNNGCHQKVFKYSSYHRNSYHSRQVISLDCGNEVMIQTNPSITSVKTDESLRMLYLNKPLQCHQVCRRDVKCDGEKGRNCRTPLHIGQRSSPWKHVGVFSSLFRTSGNKTFNRLPSSAKHLASTFSMGYQTRTWSLPWTCGLQNGWPVLLGQSVWSRQCHHQSTLPNRFDIHKNDTFKQYLDVLLSEYDNINKVLSSQSTLKDVNTKELNSRIVQLTPLVSLIKELEQFDKQIQELDVLVSDLSPSDTEMSKMAQTEREHCLKQIQELQLQLIDHLVGKEQVDNNDIILEVTAGVGGQEAMLFAGEMFDLYRTYSHLKGWSFEVINCDISDQGGLRKASASMCGMDVYKLLKFECGVHRVQRVPKTEKAGRVHTSTITVAVLPQPTEIDVVILSKDLRVETFRAGGKGGQHVNTTDSAVRIVHIPSGTVAECQQGRSQIKNKALALQILRSRIYEKELENQQMKYKAVRKLQVGTAGRSEKSRTYNFTQDRMTDHRINYSMFNLSHFMTSGEDLDNLIAMLLRESQYEGLDDILQDFAENRIKKTNPYS